MSGYLVGHCARCGLHVTSDTAFDLDTATDRVTCESCVTMRAWTATLLAAGLDARDPADPTIPSAQLEAMLSPIVATLTMYSLLALCAPTPATPLPDMVHVALALTENANLPPEQCWQLADIFPFHMLDHPAWSFILPTMTKQDLSPHERTLARLAICHFLTQGTTQKNHWLARWFQFAPKLGATYQLFNAVPDVLDPHRSQTRSTVCDVRRYVSWVACHARPTYSMEANQDGVRCYRSSMMDDPHSASARPTHVRTLLFSIEHAVVQYGTEGNV